MKVVNTREYVSILRELTEEGREASMVVAGNSMSPFLINERDVICFRKPDRELKKGDIVFYQRLNGQYIMHRIIRVRPEGYDIAGDAQKEIESPVAREQIFAVITKVKRKGRWIGPGNLWWEFFEHIWVNMVPFRRGLIAIYSRMVRHRRT